MKKQQRFLLWGRFPSDWVNERKLTHMKWKEWGAVGGAALRVYLVLAHRLEQRDGIVHASYDELMTAANLSRQSVANGLDCLEKLQVIERNAEGKGSYHFSGYTPDQGWAQVPAGPLYNGASFEPFIGWTMRKRAEFDALKLYLWFAARRDTEVNQTYTTYPQMREGTGVAEGRITSGISLLISSSLLEVTTIQRMGENKGIGMARSYRLRGLETRTHPGTTGKMDIPLEDLI